ncbi:MAG: recombinase family protein [Janthinobacterium lividum]
MTAPKPIRCAIYTRKSTEEGLEQAFNSLDAQREACAAYIASQKHEGWVSSPELYDDGGFSGGNMNRPGLTALMAEVKAGRIQVIVVYKVDRLTRALSDFAKIVEVLDAQGASFVSVTQSFNTTTSMGRLTLNVLLSFAQFEREVTGERIRDKIAASKKKGMWMGGPVPLGYDVRDRKLVINETEAATVRHIFEQYLGLGSIVATIDALACGGITTKVTRTKDGGQRGGIAWTRGALAHLLTNHAYIGETRHRDQHFPGEHEAIIAAEQWDSVQTLLATNRIERGSDRNLRHEPLLRGILFDGLGRRMQAAQANRGATRYRYYITNPADAATKPGRSWRLPAADLDKIVQQRVTAFLRDSAALYVAITSIGLSAVALASVIARATALSKQIDLGTPAGDLVHRVDVHDDQVELTLCIDGLLPMTSIDLAQKLHRLSVPMVRVKRGKDARMIVGDEAVPAAPADPALLKLLAGARTAWQAMLAAGDVPLADVASAQGYLPEQFTMLLRLATLAPCIVTAIVEGRQPPSLNRQRLATITNLPRDWAGQRSALRF